MTMSARIMEWAPHGRVFRWSEGVIFEQKAEENVG